MVRRKRIAVVGGGIFGATAAIRLARNGHSVELFEKSSDLLTAASAINQYRLHSGYHYPRSYETAVSCRDNRESFRSEYAEAVFDQFEHYLAISRQKSLVSAVQYLSFLKRVGLNYGLETPDFLNCGAVEVCIRVDESIFDPNALRKAVWRKLRESDVTVRLEKEAFPDDVAGHDFVVVATYAALNAFLNKEAPSALQNYQFEICEKPVFRLPTPLADKSVVIMDGPFMGIGPMGATGLCVIDHVVHGVLCCNVGLAPLVPDLLKPYLNVGIVQNPPFTKVKLFLEAASQYFQGMENAEYVGSMFTIKTVLPGVDDTDARPTLVRRVSDRMVTLMSGKIGTCVRAAEEVVALLDT